MNNPNQYKPKAESLNNVLLQDVHGYLSALIDAPEGAELIAKIEAILSASDIPLGPNQKTSFDRMRLKFKSRLSLDDFIPQNGHMGHLDDVQLKQLGQMKGCIQALVEIDCKEMEADMQKRHELRAVIGAAVLPFSMKQQLMKTIYKRDIELPELEALKEEFKPAEPTETEDVGENVIELPPRLSKPEQIVQATREALTELKGNVSKLVKNRRRRTIAVVGGVTLAALLIPYCSGSCEGTPETPTVTAPKEPADTIPEPEPQPRPQPQPQPQPQPEPGEPEQINYVPPEVVERNKEMMNIKYPLFYGSYTDYSEAVENSCRDTLRRRPNDAFSHNYLSVIYYRRGDYEKAKKHTLKCQELNPWEADIALAYIFVQEEKYKEAIAELMKQIRKQKRQEGRVKPDLYYTLGNTYFRNNKTEAAIRMFKKALTQDDRRTPAGKHYPSMMNLAIIYHNLGDFEKARKYYLGYIRTNPYPRAPLEKEHLKLAKENLELVNEEIEELRSD